jgi:CPA2 family monovalent cation:H+ antiporter-2
MEVPLLKDILLIFGLAIGVLLICHRLHMATTVGLLLTGVLIGPYALGVIKAVKEVEILAEIGVVLLLFTIGIEFSFENLMRIKRSVLLGGTLQVFLSIVVVFILSNQFMGLSFGSSLFIGFIISLSSTAIVLRLFQERAEVESPQGQTSLAILIFQDMIVVPMMLLTPYLSGIKHHVYGPVTPLVVKVLIFFLLVFAGSKWIVPQMLYLIARTRSRELFLMSILVICFAVAFLTQSLGLSLALGAFFAGLIISRTEFSHETLSRIVPFRDIFTSLFFVSIGMLLDVKFLLHHSGQIAFITLSIIILKILLISIVVLLLGFPIRTSLLTGLALCQVGEFSFILFLRGSEFGLLDERFYQLFLNVTVLTMGITPFMISFSTKWTDMILSLPMPMRLKRGLYGGMMPKEAGNNFKLRDHLIIVGFGFNGRNVAHAAKVSGIPYAVIEMNPQTVKDERKKAENIFYGDASHEAVLEQIKIKQARVMVIVISDPVAARRITLSARRENPHIYIIARTRFVSEMEQLHKLGANEVIPEEFETSIEIFSRVLVKYLVPIDRIQKLINEARTGGYEMFRSLSDESVLLSDLKVQIPDIQIWTVSVHEDAPASGKSLAQVQLRKKYGVTLLAIKRADKVLSNPPGDMEIDTGDLLVLLGNQAQFMAASSLFSKPEKEETDESHIPDRNQDDSSS